MFLFNSRFYFCKIAANSWRIQNRGKHSGTFHSHNCARLFLSDSGVFYCPQHAAAVPCSVQPTKSTTEHNQPTLHSTRQHHRTSPQFPLLRSQNCSREPMDEVCGVWTGFPRPGLCCGGCQCFEIAQLSQIKVFRKAFIENIPFPLRHRASFCNI